MKTSWTDGLDETRQKEVRQNFKEATVMRKRMTELVQSKIARNIVETRSKVNYQKPSWTYEQADAHGYQRALDEILSLIEN